MLFNLMKVNYNNLESENIRDYTGKRGAEIGPHQAQ